LIRFKDIAIVKIDCALRNWLDHEQNFKLIN